MAKGKLRHIAISVPDKDKAAKFYEETFGFERVSQSRVATRLSDGVMNITLLQFETEEDAGDERGKDFVGLHHFGHPGRRHCGDEAGDRNSWRQVSSRADRSHSRQCRVQVPRS
jgi:catechol 2,3-dioxygenase-like lactoylglutathione lyase family enzyme